MMTLRIAIMYNRRTMKALRPLLERLKSGKIDPRHLPMKGHQDSGKNKTKTSPRAVRATPMAGKIAGKVDAEVATKKPVSKKPVANSQTKKPTKKPLVKKTIASKPVPKKPVAKKPMAKKPAKKKVETKQPVAKKPIKKNQVAGRPSSQRGRLGESASVGVTKKDDVAACMMTLRGAIKQNQETMQQMVPILDKLHQNHDFKSIAPTQYHPHVPATGYVAPPEGAVAESIRRGK